MKQAGLAPILIILLIAAALGGYLVYSGKINFPQKQNTQTSKSEASPSPNRTDETANWKTYTDRTDGFSLKYPATWTENNNGDKVQLEDNIVNKFSRKGIEITKYENVGNLSAEQFLYRIYYQVDKEPNAAKQLSNMYIKNNVYVPVSIDGMSAVRFDLTAAHGSNGTGVWITRNNNGILIRFYPVESESEVIEQILATFKFLDQK